MTVESTNSPYPPESNAGGSVQTLAVNGDSMLASKPVAIVPAPTESVGAVVGGTGWLATDETVQVTFKPSAIVHIEIDPDQLLWDDLQMIQRVTSGKATEEEAGEMFMDLLTKLTGQDARKLPIRVVNGVIAQLEKIAGSDSQKNSA